MSVNRSFVGTGLVIGARTRLDVFSVDDDVRFVDACDLAALRTANPSWRSLPLAPVEVLDPTGTLSDIADDSVDFVIDWAMLRDAERVALRLDATARVLRPGGVFVLPVCDSRFVEPDAEVESIFLGLDHLAARLWPQGDEIVKQLKRSQRCSFAYFASIIGSLCVDHAPQFELEQLRRYGPYNLASLRRRDDASIGEHISSICGGDCHVLDHRSSSTSPI